MGMSTTLKALTPKKQETLKSFGLSSFGFGGTNTHVAGIAAEKPAETTVAVEAVGRFTVPAK